MDELCQCARCKNQHKFSDRKDVPSKDGLGITAVCPRCKAESYYDLNRLIVSVKSQNQTYTARCLGKTASRSDGPQQAARACAVKVRPGCEFEVTQQQDNRQFYFTFLAQVKEV